MNAAALRDRVLHWSLKATPSPFCSEIGAMLSPIPRHFLPKNDFHLKALLQSLRPDLAEQPSTLEAAVRRVWSSTARTYAEFSVMHRMMCEGRVSIDNAEAIDDVMASDKPVILMFVHTGNWEMTGMHLAFRYPERRILAIYDPPTNPENAKLAMTARRVMPADFIPTSRSMWRHALARLQRPRGVIWIAADELTAGQVRAPFFGRQPRFDGNLGKIVRLACRTGATIVPFYGERLDGPRFITHVLPPVQFDRTSNERHELEANVLSLNAIVSPIIISMLDQWYMALFFHDQASLNDAAGPALPRAEGRGA